MSESIKVGDEIHLNVSALTTGRKYRGAGEVVEIIPPHFGKVRYAQPWAMPDNCMRTMIVDLRLAKRIRRRVKR